MKEHLILILFGVMQLPRFGVQKFLMSLSQCTQGHPKKDKEYIWNVLPLERKNFTLYPVHCIVM